MAVSQPSQLHLTWPRFIITATCGGEYMRNGLLILLLVAVTTGGFASAQLDGETVIIDVRTLDEWNAGHLTTATHLPLDQFVNSIKALVADREQRVYLYCRSGHRSGIAKDIMEGLGYTRAINAGGLGAASTLLDKDIIP